MEIVGQKHQWREEYMKMPPEKLQQIRSGLAGNMHHTTAKARIEVIDELLKQAGIGEDQGADKAVLDSDQPFDVLVAFRYLSKRRNALQRGIEFDLTLGDVRRLLARKSCYYTGAELLDTCDEAHPQKRTFDRMDSSKGYTRDNTVACTLAANKLKAYTIESTTHKTQMTKSQLKRLARKL